MQCHNVLSLIYHLEHHFHQAHNHDGFNKSHTLQQIQPNKQKQATSWSHDLGFKRVSFNRAFDVIGIRYPSKTAYLNQIDRFQGKLYASYYNRKNNRLMYIRNHMLADPFFKDIAKTNNYNKALTDKLQLCFMTKPSSGIATT